jgi:hypothetical protein
LGGILRREKRKRNEGERGREQEGGMKEGRK